MKQYLEEKDKRRKFVRGSIWWVATFVIEIESKTEVQCNTGTEGKNETAIMNRTVPADGECKQTWRNICRYILIGITSIVNPNGPLSLVFVHFGGVLHRRFERWDKKRLLFAMNIPRVV